MASVLKLNTTLNEQRLGCLSVKGLQNEESKTQLEETKGGNQAVLQEMKG